MFPSFFPLLFLHIFSPKKCTRIEKEKTYRFKWNTIEGRKCGRRKCSFRLFICIHPRGSFRSQEKKIFLLLQNIFFPFRVRGKVALSSNFKTENFQQISTTHAKNGTEKYFRTLLEFLSPPHLRICFVLLFFFNFFFHPGAFNKEKEES